MSKAEPKPTQLQPISYIFYPKENSITSGSISFQELPKGVFSPKAY